MALTVPCPTPLFGAKQTTCQSHANYAVNLGESLASP
jgi:hypothetical protein